MQRLFKVLSTEVTLKNETDFSSRMSWKYKNEAKQQFTILYTSHYPQKLKKNHKILYTSHYPQKEKKKNQRMATTYLVLQEVVQGKRAKQSLSRRELKNRPHQDPHPSDQLQA
jgi:hypothetical protein